MSTRVMISLQDTTRDTQTRTNLENRYQVSNPGLSDPAIPLRHRDRQFVILLILPRDSNRLPLNCVTTAFPQDYHRFTYEI